MEKESKYRSLKFRLVLNVVVFSLVVTFLLAIIELSLDYKKDIDSLNRQFEQIESSFVGSISSSIWFVDKDLAQSQIDGINALPYIQFVEAYSDRSIFVSSGRKPKTGNTIERVYKLEYESRDDLYHIGRLLVIADIYPIRSKIISGFGNKILHEGLVILLIVIFIYLSARQLVFRHLDDISQFMRETNWDDIDKYFQFDRKDTVENQNDELGILADSFNFQRRELKIQHEELLKSKSRYLELAEGSIQGMWVHDQLKPLFINKSCLKIFGFNNKEEFLAMDSILKVIHPDEQERIREYNRARTAGEYAPPQYLFDCVHKNGRVLHLLTTAKLIDWEDRKVTLGTFMDITELIASENNLRLSEEKFSKAFSSSPEVFFIARIADGKIIEVNKAFEKLTGWSRRESIGRTSLDLNFLDEEVRNEALAEVNAKKTLKNREVIFKTKTGNFGTAFLSAELIKIDSEDCVLVIVKDMTEQKRMEKALLESESRLRESQELAQLGHWSWYPSNGKIVCNEIVYQIFGLKPFSIEPTIRSFVHACHPEDKHLAMQLFRGEVDTIKGNDIRVIWPDGSSHWILTTGIKEFDEQGNLIRLYGVVQNITHRKETEQALMESESRLREAQKIGRIGYWYWNVISEEIVWSSELLKIYGVDPEDKTPKKKLFLKIVHPDDRKFAVDLFRGKVDVEHGNDFRVIHPDGSVHTIFATGSTTYDEFGNVIYLQGIGQDVTERKAIEQELRDSEERLLKVFESSPDVIILTRLTDGKITEVNQNFETVFGYEKQEVIGKTGVELNMWARPEERDEIIAEIREKGGIRYKENQYRKSNGELSDCYISSQIVTIKGEPYAVTTLRDISEQKTMQEALRQSEEKFSKAFLASPYSLAITRLPDALFLDVNDAFINCFGYSKEELIGASSLEIPKIVTPGVSAAMFLEQLQKIRKVDDVEIEIQAKSGEIKICQVSAVTVTIKNEDSIIAIIQDISKRKEAEQEVLNSRERLRNLANRLEEIREEERAGISREIHDELGQALTGIKIDLTWVAERIPEEELITTRIKTMFNSIDNTVDVIRKISSELRPPLLDDLGLEAAIEWVTKDFSERTNIAYELHLDCDDMDMISGRDTAIFRIYQETLTNIARHSKAKSFQVDVRILDNELKLTVRDDGIGITDEQLQNNNSIGLMGMQERARHIGATISVRNSETGGTVVNLSVPLSPETKL